MLLMCLRFTVGHIKQCKAINTKCSNCKKIGHFAKVCQQREINNTETNVNNTSGEETETYQVSICNIETTQNELKFSTTLKNDFMSQVSINNNMFEYLLTLTLWYQFAALSKLNYGAY